MLPEDKVAHLLRRFGLGAGRTEVEKYLPLGVDGTIDRLINFEKVRDTYPVSIWEWYFQPDGKYNMDPTRVRAWWQLKMLVTERPLEEKLTLFWHNHFAVSGSKVEFGPMMKQYVDVMRDNCTGSFANLLTAVSKTPAMLRWLDTDQSYPGHPNENFGREVMELFTLGIGNYSERDVQEAARCFVGWGIRYPLYEKLGGDQRQKVLDAIKYEYPLVAFSYTPDMRDRGHKTILGKTTDYDADGFLKVLAYHPVTAKRMLTKLWSFFAYENPEPAVIDMLTKVWYKNDLHIKPVLLAIAHSKEFWSEKALRTMVKSPVDYTVGLLREFGAGKQIMDRRRPAALPTDSMLDVAQNDMYQVSRVMRNQGLDMLYPGDVSGWKWGTNWITAATMVDRIRVQEVLFIARSKQGALAKPYVDKLVAEHASSTSQQVVADLLDRMDVKLSPEKSAILVSQVDALGGPAKAFANPGQATNALRKVCKVLFAAPEFQLC